MEEVAHLPSVGGTRWLAAGQGARHGGDEPALVLMGAVREEDPAPGELEAGARCKRLRHHVQPTLRRAVQRGRYQRALGLREPRAGPVILRAGARQYGRRPPAAAKRRSSSRLASTQRTFSSDPQLSPCWAYQARCSRWVGRAASITASAAAGVSRSARCQTARPSSSAGGSRLVTACTSKPRSASGPKALRPIKPVAPVTSARVMPRNPGSCDRAPR